MADTRRRAQHRLAVGSAPAAHLHFHNFQLGSPAPIAVELSPDSLIPNAHVLRTD